MSLFLAFVLIFGVGPLGFVLLLRPAPRRAYLRGLALVLLTLGVAALLVPEELVLGFGRVLLLWAGWVVLLALAVQLLRRRAAAPPGLRRAGIVAGALATTAPWFGLATARLIAG